MTGTSFSLPGWTRSFSTRARKAVTEAMQAAAPRVQSALSKASGPFMHDPRPSRFRQSFEVSVDGAKMLVDNTATNRSGERYAGFVHLRGTRQLHLPVVFRKVRTETIPQVAGLITAAIQSTMR